MKNIIHIVISLIALTAASVNAQPVIENFSYEISVYGDVILTWDIPQGTSIDRYQVYRGQTPVNAPWIADIHSSSAQKFTDYHANVIPGNTYYYYLRAIDLTGQESWVSLRSIVTPPPTLIQFSSAPITTAFVGNAYLYLPTVQSVEPDSILDLHDIEFSFGGPVPDGMFLSSVAGTITRLDWTPFLPGQWRITLIARHRKTGAFTVQEFKINVAEKPGTVTGSVRTVDNKPIAFAKVRVFQTTNAIEYETVSDVSGLFVFPIVESGELFAYVKTPSDLFVSQWYPLGKNLVDVSARRLLPGDTLVFPFTLLPNPDIPIRVHGVVTEIPSNQPVDHAELLFIRKGNFIHIGDTSVISNPTFLDDFQVDTTVLTDGLGQYAVNLHVNENYYVVVRKSGYLSSFSQTVVGADITNALEARVLTVSPSTDNVDFSMIRVAVTTPNRIIGAVRNGSNDVDKQAVVIVFDSELKRGAGGGGTYLRFQSTLTDRNGFYSFDNLVYQSTYSILAIPLEKNLSPLYFNSLGGTTNATQSADVKPNGTMQNIDFDLEPTSSNGVGTIYGRVTIRLNGSTEIPSTGTLVFARDLQTGVVFGYAITDSAGWYSIPGLPSNTYTLYAENLRYGRESQDSIPLVYTNYNLFTATKLVNLAIDASIVSVRETPLPRDVTLYQNYPNPFNPTTTIEYALPSKQKVNLRILNSLGQEVKILIDENQSQGLHSVSFDASEMSSGLYFYQLRVEKSVITKSMVLTK